MTRRPPLAALVMAALALALTAGCGDDDDTATDDTSTTAPDATGDDGDGGGGDDGDDADDNGGDDNDDGDDGDGGVPDACDLLDAAEVEPFVGVVEPESEAGTSIDLLAYSQCEWETDDALVVLAIVGGAERFETHRDNLPGEPVEGLGDEALTFPGVSSETRGGSGGRTISVRVGDRTLVVALRIEGETTVDLVRPLAEAALGRLG